MILTERVKAQASLRDDAPARRSFVWLYLILALALAGGAFVAITQMQDPAAYPIRKVTIDGDFRYLAPTSIKAAVSSAVRGGFFEVDVQDVREKILEEPWVKEATVRRIWPDTIHVSIVEQQPVAYWGESALLNDDADVFAPNRSSFPPGLVRLSGPVGAEVEILATYRQAMKSLGAIGLGISAVNLSARRAWTLSLKDGSSVVLGRRGPLDRLERFVQAYQHILRDHWDRVAVIDLRYTNGFSIRERDDRVAASTVDRIQ